MDIHFHVNFQNFDSFCFLEFGSSHIAICLNFFSHLNCLNELAFVNLTLNMLLEYYPSYFNSFLCIFMKFYLIVSFPYLN